MATGPLNTPAITFADPDGQSVSVPAGAQSLVLYVFIESTGNWVNVNPSATLDGQSADQIRTSPVTSVGCGVIAFVWGPGKVSGGSSQTLLVTTGVNLPGSLSFSHLAFDGVPAIVDLLRNDYPIENNNGSVEPEIICSGGADAIVGDALMCGYISVSLNREVETVSGDLTDFAWGKDLESSVGVGWGISAGGAVDGRMQWDSAWDGPYAALGILLKGQLTGPVITSHDPIRAGGTDVAINGLNLSNIKLVLLDGVPQSNVRVVSDTLVLFDVVIGGVLMSNVDENPLTLTVRE